MTDRGQQGFALLEVVVATGVLVFILLGVAGMSLTAEHHLHRSGEQSAATTLGLQRIEWLRNQGYASSDLAAGTTVEDLTGDYVGYTRTTVVQDGVPETGIKLVTVTTVTPAGLPVSVTSLVAP